MDISHISIWDNAAKGYYFNGNKWTEASLLERVVRAIFSTFLFFLVDSVTAACEKRSWRVISNLESVPPKIAENIETLFQKARDYKNKYSFNEYTNLTSETRSIAKIYAKAAQAKNGSAFPCHFTIQEDNRRRLFHVDQGVVVNSAYAVLDFYNGKEKRYTNRDDDLFSGKDLIGHVKNISYVSTTDDDTYFYKYYSAHEKENDAPAFTLHRTFDSSVFYARDPVTKKAVAIALWNKPLFGLMKWSVTLTDPHFWDAHTVSTIFQTPGAKIDLLILTLMKHIQKHNRGPRERPYIKNYIA